MKKKVVKGCVYSVTAKEDTTITDSAGLNLTVKAGTQETFTAASSEVDLSKEAELVLIKGNFSPASNGTSGGGGGSDSPRAEKLAEYLYEMHVDAIDYDFAEKYFQDHDYPAEAGACSAVKAGNIFGRNFDWTYNRDDTYVVRIRPTATRSASISVAARVTKDTDSRIIPFLAKDGINEAGLCVSINVVPHGDKGDNSTVVTAGSDKTLCTVMVPRYILDHFTTAAAAAQAMQTFSYYHPASTIASGYEHHFLIADKDNAYILEFVEGAVVVTEVNGTPFMTNFHVDGTTLNADNSVYTPATQTETETAFSYNHITKHGAGLERWNILAAGVAGATDVEGMRTLMTSLKYTNTYRAETAPRWDTELVGIAELEVDSPTADFTPVHAAVQEQFSQRTRDDAPELQTWQTVHSSVYDMKALSLQLVVQEDDSAKYSFALYKGGGEEIELDQIPTQGHVKQAVSSDGVYTALQAKQDNLTFDDYPKYMSNNPVKSSGLYPTPYNVVRNGVISFEESPDPMDPDNPKCFMHPNTLYIVWDNDLDDREAVAVLPDNLMPDYFTTAELHIFNHQATPISLKWPAGWHWYDKDSNSYKKDTDGHVYSPELTGRSCMCVTVRCSVFDSTHFTPTMRIDPFIMAEVAYVHQMYDEDSSETE